MNADIIANKLYDDINYMKTLINQLCKEYNCKQDKTSQGQYYNKFFYKNGTGYVTSMDKYYKNEICIYGDRKAILQLMFKLNAIWEHSRNHQWSFRFKPSNSDVEKSLIYIWWKKDGG